MGEVVDLRPVDESLEFSGEAAAKRDILIARLISAQRKLLCTTAQMAGDTCSAIDDCQDEVLKAQREYSAWLGRASSMADACEAVHQCIDELSPSMPQGANVHLLAWHKVENIGVVFRVQRRGLRFFCSDFEVYERADGTLVPLFSEAA